MGNYRSPSQKRRDRERREFRELRDLENMARARILTRIIGERRDALKNAEKDLLEHETYVARDSEVVKAGEVLIDRKRNYVHPLLRFREIKIPADIELLR